MIIYTFAAAIIGVLAGLGLAFFSQKDEGLKYGKLDKAGIFTNIILALVYLCAAPMYMYLGITARPALDGFPGIVGWVVSFIIASTAPVAFVGLGLSVLLRKHGMSKQSFALQFLGLGAIALCLLLTWCCTGSLLVASA